MTIIDTFSFSEPHETEILYLKLILEEQYISEWVIVENNYSFQGEKKQYFLDSILREERFKIFSSKVTYLKCSYRPEELKGKLTGVYDEIAMRTEEFQREIAKEYLISKYQTKDTYILLSDTDEMIDFSCPDRANLVMNKMKKGHDFFRIPHTRFWYDFDNLWSEIRSIPAVSLSYIIDSKYTLSHIRFFICGSGPAPLWKLEVAFEYSYCFEKQGIFRKYDSFFHTGVTKDEIEQAISCNHIVVSKARDQALTLEPKYWLKKANLTPSNSPEYVRQNLSNFKTNVIPPSFQFNRYKTYNSFFYKLPFFNIFLFKPLHYFLQVNLFITRKIKSHFY